MGIFKLLEILLGILRNGGLEREQNGLSAKCGERLVMSMLIWQRKVWGLNRREQPGFRGCGEYGRWRKRRVRIDGRRRCRGKGFDAQRRFALLHPDAMILRKIRNFLRQAAGPANCGLDRALRCAEAEMQFFGVLREEARSGLQTAGLAASFCFDSDARADGVAIAFFAGKAKGDGRAESWQYVFEQAQLRGVTIFQNEFEATIMIEVGQGKGSTVFDAIEAHNSRYI